MVIIPKNLNDCQFIVPIQGLPQISRKSTDKFLSNPGENQQTNEAENKTVLVELIIVNIYSMQQRASL